ncbi:hypothetical protein GCM10011318_25700 [Phaeocystidibacter marisrubri]|nr:hypothetical protein GCM10011318_25700 [Phaeocystidibacter marisrubri]
MACFGQKPRPVSAKDSTQVREQVNQRVSTLGEALAKTNEWNEVSIAFQVDTSAIEQRLRLYLDIDYSTSGMIKYTLGAEEAYDQLLNKYYRLLLDKLNEEDQSTLIQAQNYWQLYRESERTLNRKLSNEDYSGGGSIQAVFTASRYLAITKARVLELYRYLLRFENVTD